MSKSSGAKTQIQLLLIIFMAQNFSVIYFKQMLFVQTLLVGFVESVKKDLIHLFVELIYLALKDMEMVSTLLQTLQNVMIILKELKPLDYVHNYFAL